MTEASSPAPVSPELTSPELTSPELTSPELASPEQASPSEAASSGFELSLQQRRAHTLGAPVLRGVLRITADADAPRLEPDAWRRAVSAIVARHEILRTTFVPVPGGRLPLQVPVADARVDWQPEVDLARTLGVGEDPDGWLADACEALADAPFDLASGPLLRLRLVDLSASSGSASSESSSAGGSAAQWALLVAWPAMIADAPSLVHFGRELVGQLSGQGAVEEPLQYVDFAHWQKEIADDPDTAEEAESWSWTKDARPSAALVASPADRPPSDQDQPNRRQIISLSDSLGPRVWATAARLEVDEIALLLAAWHVLLWRFGGESARIGCAIDGRAMEELDSALGPFVSHLPTTADLRAGGGFDDLARRMSGVLEGAAAAHEVFSWDALPQRGDGPPTFDYGLDVARVAPEGDGSRPYRLASVAMEASPEPFRLVLVARPLVARLVEGQAAGTHPESLELALHGRDIHPGSLAAVAEAFETLLAAACEQPEATIDALPMVAGATLNGLLTAAWGPSSSAASSTFVPVHQRIVDQLAARVKRQADRVADDVVLVAGSRRMRDEELAEASTGLARWLQVRGVGAEVRVALVFERNPELVVAILGVLRAGGAYVPIDPAYPPARQQRLLQDSGASLLLTEERLLPSLPTTRPETMTLEAIARQLVPGPADSQEADSREVDAREVALTGSASEATEPAPEVMAEQLAYVLYTSGSTGHPKGVAVSHGALASYLDWAVTAYLGKAGDAADDRGDARPMVPVVTSPSFDLTVTSLLAPLISGHGLVLVDEARGLDALMELLAEPGRFSLLKLTPSHLRFLASALGEAQGEGRAVDCLVVGGEALRGDHLVKLAGQWPETRLINEYGPTEATVGCVAYERRLGALGASSLNTSTVPIGHSIAAARAHLLDSWLQPVPVDALGELYLGGPGLARGYLGRPARTAERFVPDPWSAIPGERLYRTGDQARRLPGASGEGHDRGGLMYVGRADDQVKIRGYRIEVEEIERTAAQHPAVETCAVAVAADATGEDRLVSYWVPAGSAQASDPATLRAYLAEQLPGFMVPDLLIPLDRLPLTVHGKLDRDALPAPETVRPRLRQVYVAPRDDLETALAVSWQRFLGLEQVGIDDRVFDLGGNSWLALQVHATLGEQRGLTFPVIELFNHPTVRDLAAHLRGHALEVPAEDAPDPREGLDQASDVARRRRQAAASRSRARARGRDAGRDTGRDDGRETDSSADRSTGQD